MACKLPNSKSKNYTSLEIDKIFLFAFICDIKKNSNINLVYYISGVKKLIALITYKLLFIIFRFQQ